MPKKQIDDDDFEDDLDGDLDDDQIDFLSGDEEGKEFVNQVVTWVV